MSVSLLDSHLATVSIGSQVISTTAGVVTMDEAWTPFVQAQFTCPIPSLEVRDLLDPRTAPRVRVTLARAFGYEVRVSEFNAAYSGKTVAQFNAAWLGKTINDLNRTLLTPWNGVSRSRVERSLNLGVIGRKIDHRAGTMTLTLESDESILRGLTQLSASSTSPGGTSVRSAVAWILAKIGATLETGTATGTVTTDALEWMPGVTAWEYLAPLVQAAGLRLYCDGRRRWFLVESGTIVDGTTVLGAGENLIEAAEDVSIADASDYVTGVLVRYRWTDAFDLSQEAYDFAGTPAIVAVVEHERAYPGPGAAAAILARRAGRGRVLDLSSTSDYSAEPTRTLIASLPSTPIQTGLISSVKWEFPSGRMQVNSRGLVDTPATAWTLSPTGRQWSSIPVGTDWTEYTT